MEYSNQKHKELETYVNNTNVLVAILNLYINLHIDDVELF